MVMATPAAVAVAAMESVMFVAESTAAIFAPAGMPAPEIARPTSDCVKPRGGAGEERSGIGDRIVKHGAARLGIHPCRAHVIAAANIEALEIAYTINYALDAEFVGGNDVAEIDLLGKATKGMMNWVGNCSVLPRFTAMDWPARSSGKLTPLQKATAVVEIDEKLHTGCQCQTLRREAVRRAIIGRDVVRKERCICKTVGGFKTIV